MDADDGLKIHQNVTHIQSRMGQRRSKWSFLNGMTSKKIVAIIREAMKNDTDV